MSRLGSCLCVFCAMQTHTAGSLLRAIHHPGPSVGRRLGRPTYAASMARIIPMYIFAASLPRGSLVSSVSRQECVFLRPDTNPDSDSDPNLNPNPTLPIQRTQTQTDRCRWSQSGPKIDELLDQSRCSMRPHPADAGSAAWRTKPSSMSNTSRLTANIAPESLLTVRNK